LSEFLFVLLQTCLFFFIASTTVVWNTSDALHFTRSWVTFIHFFSSKRTWIISVFIVLHLATFKWLSHENLCAFLLCPSELHDQ